MKILFVEPFYTGSHQQWMEGYRQFSGHELRVLSLPGRHWKWRMYGGAVALAEQFLQLQFQPDVIIASDMLDLGTFLALTRTKSAATPCYLYFHENQITYPWSPQDKDVQLKRNNQYGFINYTSALAADRVFFNSEYHRTSFIQALPNFLKQFPDHKGIHNVECIKNKSSVLPLGMHLQRLDHCKCATANAKPIVLWNHRWEYDKNPDLFFETLFRIDRSGIDFELVVLGESFQKTPPIFKEAQHILGDKIIHFGYAANFEDYANWLWKADVLPVTSNQDFFGISAVEGMYAGCYPLVPNRLAFPSHLPWQLREEFVYDTDEAFYLKLKAILSRKNLIVPEEIRNFVAQYDWSVMAPIYDKTFEE